MQMNSKRLPEKLGRPKKTLNHEPIGWVAFIHLIYRLIIFWIYGIMNFYGSSFSECIVISPNYWAKKKLICSFFFVMHE